MLRILSQLLRNCTQNLNNSSWYFGNFPFYDRVCTASLFRLYISLSVSALSPIMVALWFAQFLMALNQGRNKNSPKIIEGMIWFSFDEISHRRWIITTSSIRWYIYIYRVIEPHKFKTCMSYVEMCRCDVGYRLDENFVRFCNAQQSTTVNSNFDSYYTAFDCKRNFAPYLFNVDRINQLTFDDCTHACTHTKLNKYTNTHQAKVKRNHW